MAVLFLDPLVLTLLVLVLVHVWLVWRGSIRRWFGRSDGWTALVWPAPMLLLLVPTVGSGALTVLRWVGLVSAEGGAVDAAAYTAAYGGPALAALWPPRWLLPRWARARLTALPVSGADTVPGAVAACHGRPGHGSAARWRWRVDAVPGHVWLHHGHLRFQASRDADPPATAAVDVDADAFAGLTVSTEGDLHLEAPRGGWWSAASLDVDLAQVDRWRVRARRPWSRSGALTIEVDGRRPVHLWVADARTLTRQLDAG